MSAPLRITAVGGTSWDVHLGDEYLGREEFGTLTDGGQYAEDDDDVIEHVRAAYGIDASIPATVR